MFGFSESYITVGVRQDVISVIHVLKYHLARLLNKYEYLFVVFVTF